MNGVCVRRKNCRLCDSPNLAEVLRLAPTPPANAYVRSENADQTDPVFPLDLHLCENCGHLQLLDVVDPSLLFGHYLYVSGTSPVFVAHFQALADLLSRELGLNADSLVVEIGSNDGTLLRCFKSKGARILGVDPAKNLAEAASRDGIPTRAAFFSPEIAKDIKASEGAADCVVANNVFAHIDDLRSVAIGIRELLKPNGLFIFEVSYLVDVYEKTLFDTIYHEHLCYHAVKPLLRFFESVGMELVDAERIGSHGGSLRGFAQIKGGSRPVRPSIRELMTLEERLGLFDRSTYVEFGAKIDRLKGKFLKLIDDLKRQGKKIAGFGAPAKATTLMHHFGIDRSVVEFIVDDSPLKQGMLTPGTHVPIVPAAEIARRKPDALVVLAWNFADPIIAKHKDFTSNGGSFIVPLPELKTVSEPRNL